MPRIVQLRQTCEAAPAQWEGCTDDNRPVYIRFRHDCLSVKIGAVGGDIDEAVSAPAWFEQEIDEADPWRISIERVSVVTGIVIDCAVQKSR